MTSWLKSTSISASVMPFCAFEFPLLVTFAILFTSAIRIEESEKTALMFVYFSKVVLCLIKNDSFITFKFLLATFS